MCIRDRFTPTREPPRTPRPGVGGLERPAATCADPPREKWRTKKERSPRRNSNCFRTKVHRSPHETKDRRPETTRSDPKDRSHRGRASFRGRIIVLEAQNHSRTLPFRSVLDLKTLLLGPPESFWRPPPYTLQKTYSTHIHSHKGTDPHAAQTPKWR